MKKLKTSIIELIKKNKEEIMKDREKLEKIEKRIEDKYSKG
ncbi:FbpB family small basic protein [Neobacillus sp. D3-1R]